MDKSHVVEVVNACLRVTVGDPALPKSVGEGLVDVVTPSLARPLATARGFLVWDATKDEVIIFKVREALVAAMSLAVGVEAFREKPALGAACAVLGVLFGLRARGTVLAPGASLLISELMAAPEKAMPKDRLRAALQTSALTGDNKDFDKILLELRNLGCVDAKDALVSLTESATIRF